MTVENKSSNGESLKKVRDYISDLSILPKNEEGVDERRKLHEKILKELNLINDLETDLVLEGHYGAKGNVNHFL